MGLNLTLYNLRDYQDGDNLDEYQDDRFDWLRQYEDHDFVAWLNARNAIFKVIGPPEALDEDQRFYDEAQRRLGVPVLHETLQQRMEQYGGQRHGLSFDIWVFERPKDFVAARAWVRDYVHPFLEIWNRKRFEDVLDLMEGDENLWLYEG